MATNFRYGTRQRDVTREEVRRAPGFKEWAVKNTIVSRAMTVDEINRAIDDLNIRLPVMVALRKAKELPIWDRSLQKWCGVAPGAAVPPTPAVPPAPTPDTMALFDIVVKQDARIKQLEIALGLEPGDPEELADVSHQREHVAQIGKNLTNQNPH